MFRSDLSLFGSGVLAASRTQLTKIVNKMKYSKGLVSVKEIQQQHKTNSGQVISGYNEIRDTEQSPVTVLVYDKAPEITRY